MAWFTTFTAGTKAKASETNNNFICVVPIGGIIPWGKSIPGCPALPAAFKECDGTTISDADSPMNGQAVPNLNGSTEATKKFLRGSTTSGTTGGTATHTHTGTTGSSNNNPYQGAGAGTTAPDSGHTHDFTSAASGTIPPYYETVFIIRIK